MQVARDNVWNLYCRYSTRIRTRIRIHIRIQMRESLKLYAKKRNKEKPLQKNIQRGEREVGMHPLLWYEYTLGEISQSVS